MKASERMETIRRIAFFWGGGICFACHLFTASVIAALMSFFHYLLQCTNFMSWTRLVLLLQHILETILPFSYLPTLVQFNKNDCFQYSS